MKIERYFVLDCGEQTARGRGGSPEKPHVTAEGWDGDGSDSSGESLKGFIVPDEEVEETPVTTEDECPLSSARGKRSRARRRPRSPPWLSSPSTVGEESRLVHAVSGRKRGRWTEDEGRRAPSWKRRRLARRKMVVESDSETETNSCTGGAMLEGSSDPRARAVIRQENIAQLVERVEDDLRGLAAALGKLLGSIGDVKEVLSLYGYDPSLARTEEDSRAGQ